MSPPDAAWQQFDLRIAPVRPQGRPRDHRGRQMGEAACAIGLGLSAQRVDVSAIAEDPGGHPGRGAGGRTGQAGPDTGIADGDTARVYHLDVARLTGPA